MWKPYKSIAWPQPDVWVGDIADEVTLTPATLDDEDCATARPPRARM